MNLNPLGLKERFESSSDDEFDDDDNDIDNYDSVADDGQPATTPDQVNRPIMLTMLYLLVINKHVY